MIKFSNNEASFYTLLASFYDYDTPRSHYTNDKRYYENLAAKWGHITGLTITPVIPTATQIERLAIVNNLVDDNKELNGGTYANFVEFGIVDDLPILQDHKDNYIVEVLEHYRELKRKELQALRDSIIASDINNIQVGRQQDRENLEKAVENFDQEATTRTWIMADNSTAQLTLQQLTDALEGYWYRLEDCFTAYGQAIEDLKLLTTVEDIQNFTCEDLTNA